MKWAMPTYVSVVRGTHKRHEAIRELGTRYELPRKIAQEV